VCEELSAMFVEFFEVSRSVFQFSRRRPRKWKFGECNCVSAEAK
jgi:hypothetical protein